jgi:hypothetical protein
MCVGQQQKKVDPQYLGQKEMTYIIVRTKMTSIKPEVPVLSRGNIRHIQGVNGARVQAVKLHNTILTFFPSLIHSMLGNRPGLLRDNHDYYISRCL